MVEKANKRIKLNVSVNIFDRFSAKRTIFRFAIFEKLINKQQKMKQRRSFALAYS